MKQYTFSKLSKMGVYDEKYGQTYWGEPNEQLEPVKFNSMNQDITENDTIEAEEVLLKVSSKGTEYHQLRKVKVVVGSPTAHSDPHTPPPTPHGANPSVGYTDQVLERVIRIEAKIDGLLGAETAKAIQTTPGVTDEELTQTDEDFLKNIPY